MFKLVDTETNLIKMIDMEPLQIGYIYSPGPTFKHLVMRTASNSKFEVMDLTDPRADGCWTHEFCTLKIEPLSKGKNVLLELYNK